MNRLLKIIKLYSQVKVKVGENLVQVKQIILKKGTKRPGLLKRKPTTPVTLVALLKTVFVFHVETLTYIKKRILSPVLIIK
jgi:hypothetical protein